MRAVLHERYGPPEVLRVAEVERPSPQSGEVLVRVRASSVTRSDCGVRNSEYWFARAVTGVRRPKRIVAGMEFAGVVEAAGAGVTAFAPGDEVFGIKGGSNAEYVCVAETGVIAKKPPRLSFEEAAVVAVDPSSGDTVGLARFVRDPDGPEAEVAFEVVDAWQGRGVGQRLVAELALLARSHGILRLRAHVARENRAALALLRSVGDVLVERPYGAEVELVVRLP